MTTHRRIPYNLLAVSMVLSLGACLGEPPPNPDPGPLLTPMAPVPTLAPAGRLVAQDVYQGQGAERLRVGVVIMDQHLRTPVGPAPADDGVVRWLPLEDWVPSAVAPDLAQHSADRRLWLDAACSRPFALTPPNSRPRFVWQTVGPLANLHRVWRIGDARGQAEEVSQATWWTADASGVCYCVDASEHEQLRGGRGAWTLGEALDPRTFVEAQFSAETAPPRMAESLSPVFRQPARRPALLFAASAAPTSCDQTDSRACGGIRSLCNCENGTPPKTNCYCKSLGK